MSIHPRTTAGIARALALLTALVAAFAFAAPGRSASFQAPISFTIGSGESSQCQALTVADNTQLTITFASVYTEASTTGQQVVAVFLFTKLTGQSTDSFNAVPVTSINSVSYLGSQVMTAYADAGITNNPRLCVTRSTTSGTMAVLGSVNGTTSAP
ncbi:MAG TPA: hypothetical protein VGS22_02590 [Thermoanaerobaculia bacterium]|jgi:hypothetical protein|nr:hypothetical protein [Thermoanaerobaculia bacterium]